MRLLAYFSFLSDYYCYFLCPPFVNLFLMAKSQYFSDAKI
ncbi:putative membrane protein [Bacteroides uniformis str. 3978 T3 i]|nr:putative membrane protein [Bacteroides uniformis str. 3978 T3 i]